jgi:hypothetical protein
MIKNHLVLMAMLSFCFGIQIHAGIFDKDYEEFVLTSLGPNSGFSTTMLGPNGSVSIYESGLAVSSNGSLYGEGKRIDYAPGLNFDSTTHSVVFSGQLGTPTTEIIHSELFYKRIGARMVELRREIVSKSVMGLAQSSDGGILKGLWAFNVEREQKAVVRRGKLEYSWTEVDSWYSGHLLSWYQEKMGRDLIGDDVWRR